MVILKVLFSTKIIKRMSSHTHFHFQILYMYSLHYKNNPIFNHLMMGHISPKKFYHQKLKCLPLKKIPKFLENYLIEEFNLVFNQGSTI